MRAVTTKLKPKSGFSHIIHVGLNALLPAIIFVLVRINFGPLAAALILLSKWRMFSVRPRYWPAIIKANGVDLTVGLSIVIFMMQTSSAAVQLTWAASYAVWLIAIKPGTSISKTSLQALIAQLLGLMAIFSAWSGAPLYILVVLVGAVCYLAARHFFTSFEEAYTPLYANMWGYVGASLTWLLGHWLLFYGEVAQPVLLLNVLGFGLAAMYYLAHTDRLSVLVRRQFVFIMLAVVAVVLVFSDWGDKAV